MTPTALRELAAEMRECEKSDWNAGESIWRERASYWASFLESLAGEWAVVPREPTDAIAHALCGTECEKCPATLMTPYGAGMQTCRALLYERYRAMIEAAERQETK